MTNLRSLCPLRILLVSTLSFGGALFAEDWPADKRGGAQTNASTVDVAPSGLLLAWQRTFDNPVRFSGGWRPNPDVDPDIEGVFHSRNLVLLDGKLALVGNDGDASDQPRVTVLDSADGRTLNCIEVYLQRGNNGMRGPYPNRPNWNGADNFHGAASVAWDPESGYLFLAAAGDGPSQTAYDPMANANDYEPGKAQKGVAAFAHLIEKHAELADAHGNRRPEALKAGTLVEPPTAAWGIGLRFFERQKVDPAEASDALWLQRQPTWNRVGYMHLALDEPYGVFPHSGGHGQTGYPIVFNKHTGMLMQTELPRLENGEHFQPFSRMGGVITFGGRLFGVGTQNNEGDGNKFRDNRHPQQGLSLTAYDLTASDEQPNGSVSGPAALDTVAQSLAWRHELPTLLANGEPMRDPNQAEAPSNAELDGFFRDKPLIAGGDGGLWYAWKPGLAQGVQIVHAGDDGLRKVDLPAGEGRPGWQLWPHLSLVDAGGRPLLVYYHGNQLRRERTRETVEDRQGREREVGAWSKELLPPAGPAELCVADALTGEVLHHHIVSTANANLPPNPFWGYLERSHMLVAGRWAYVAWVDGQGEVLQLKLWALDVTNPSARPTGAIIPLGIPAEGARRSVCNGLIAADGRLYAHILVGDRLAIVDPHFDKQMLVAIGN